MKKVGIALGVLLAAQVVSRTVEAGARWHTEAAEATVSLYRTVNRDDVYRGAEELGVELDGHIAFVVQALARVAPEIGLSTA